MASENVEIVRGMLEAWRRGDTDAALSAFAADCVYKTPLEVYHGREGVDEGTRRFVGTFDDYRFEIEEVSDVGEDRVVCLARQSGRVKGSGAQVEADIGHVYEIRDREIVGLRLFTTREETLAAAGLGRRPD
jgi:ketosteroid isomerase-like protein